MFITENKGAQQWAKMLKEKIDSWYQNHMTSYTSKLEDTIWCNDRSVHQLSGWAPDGNVAEVLHDG